MIGSILSGFIGTPGLQRKFFVSSLIGEESSRHQEKSKGKLNPLLLIIPTIFDLSEALCSNIGLTLIAASITQMLRTTLIIFTACFSVWILHMKLFNYHYLSLGLILIGIISLGLSQIFYPSASDESTQNSTDEIIIGVVVIIVGQVFGALNYIFEEKFLSYYDDLHPLIVVGWEGIWGSIILFFMLLIFQYIPC